MSDRLDGQEYFYFLDGYYRYNQIAMCQDDEEKAKFTYPCGIFVFERMPFGLCTWNFQRCPMCIFSDMIENVVELFVDGF